MADVLHRTLIIRLSSVGDIVLSSLLLRVLRTQYPTCEIDYLVKGAYGDLVRFNPHVSTTIEFPDEGDWGELKRMRNRIQSSNYDLIIDIHDSLRSRYICRGFPRVARIRKRKIARFLLVKTKWDVYEWFGGSPSVAERYLEPVAGLKNDGNGLEVFFPKGTSERTRDMLTHAGASDGGQVIGICPASRHENKMWLKERFAQTAVELSLEINAAVALFGSGQSEIHRCEEIKTLINQTTPTIPVINLAGRLSLPETAAMMDFCSIVITNDTGLMHLAAARKRKVVAIFGPTVRELGFFPYGTTSTVIEDISLPCRPCTHIGLPSCPKKHFKCMRDIEAAQVIDAARHLLKSPA